MDNAASTIWAPHYNDVAFRGLCSVGDLDNDGFDEIVVSKEGAIYLFFGPHGGERGLEQALEIDLNEKEPLGVFLTCPGDVDGDGHDDIVANSPDNARVWMIRGPLDSGWTSEVIYEDKSETTFGIGDHIAVGDHDEDGMLDLMVGVPLRGRNAIGEPSFVGGVDRVLDIAGALRTSWSVVGNLNTGLMGADVGLGDFDGDGVDDLIVGAPQEDGRVLIFGQ
ncbi:MAG: hypothetical protein HN348_18940 [Proteobacteria bacterium]|nr:hypothetical protein [Pseudomonadota bacterium]